MKEIEADEGAAEVEEGLMNVAASLVAHRQPPEASQPGEGALHHPAVAAEPLAGVDAFAGDAAGDPAPSQVAAAARDVVGLVGVQPGRRAAWSGVHAGGPGRSGGGWARWPPAGPRTPPTRARWPRSARSRAGCRGH